MATAAYRTSPDQSETHVPKGIPYIVSNECAERFSFYGMRGILVIFMTKYLLDAAGEHVEVSDEQAKSIYHLFTAGAYFFPLLGAVISDVLWGKYKTILLISLMYCLGHAMLALMDLGPSTGLWDMTPLLYLGLLLIAIGSGGIKPCVSAHVGDQFGAGNKHLITKIFNWFYFSINLGAAASNIITPWLLERVGPWAAFGLPGALMGLATFLFWLGRNTFIHVPPSGWEQFRAETFSKAGTRALKNLSPLFLIFVPVFWMIFDQTGSAWVLQAESMNREFLGVTWLESQVQFVNPVLILILIPFCTYVVYPMMGKLFEPTPLRKIGIGFVLAASSFAVSALIETGVQRDGPAAAASLRSVVEQRLGSPPDGVDQTATRALLDGPPQDLATTVKLLRQANWPQEILAQALTSMPNIGWQFFAYILLTAGEVMVSIVCLEFAYTQSPPRMKSFVMGVYFLGVSLGNLAVSALNLVLELFKDEAGRTALEGPIYYWFFAGLMLATTAVYVVFSLKYKGQTYIQGDAAAH